MQNRVFVFHFYSYTGVRIVGNHFFFHFAAYNWNGGNATRASTRFMLAASTCAIL